jgi:hypothetical protein
LAIAASYSWFEFATSYSNLYIGEMLKARQHQRSHVCPQELLDFSVEDEWFEVSLLHFNRLWMIRLCKL